MYMCMNVHVFGCRGLLFNFYSICFLWYAILALAVTIIVGLPASYLSGDCKFLSDPRIIYCTAD